MFDYFKFYFLNGTVFLKYYKKKILASTILIIISALATFLKDFGYDKEVWGRTIFLILQYSPVIIIILILFVEFISTFINYFINKPDVLVKKMMFDGYYLAENRYSLIIRNYCRNVGKTSIRELTGIREAYYQEPSELYADAALLENESSSSVSLTEQPAFNLQSHTVGGRNVTVFKYSWNLQFTPPIDINSDFNYAVKIDARTVEENVFENSGTIFSYPPYYTTQEMIITLHSKDGYIFKLFNFTVNDERGNEVKKEKRKLLKPKLIALGTVLYWRIILPQKHLRYNLSYRLERIV